MGILLGSWFPRFNRSPTPPPTGECPASLPLDPIHHHPLLPNDTHLNAAQEELSERLHDKLNDTDSAVVIAIHGGQTILEWTHGRIRSNVSEEEDNRKVNADTIWRVASITKVFTVLEALVQEQKGALSLDDDVRKYIEGFTLYKNGTDRVPLRALGSHLSGLGRDSIFGYPAYLTVVLANDRTKLLDTDDIHAFAPAFCDPDTNDTSNGTEMCSKKDILKAIATRPLAFEPWTRPLYSNTGFDLLGWATTEAVKTSTKSKKVKWEDLLHEDIFTPLNMEDSSFWVPEDKRRNVAVPRKGTPAMIDWDFTSTFNPYVRLVHS